MNPSSLNCPCMSSSHFSLSSSHYQWKLSQRPDLEQDSEHQSCFHVFLCLCAAAVCVWTEPSISTAALKVIKTSTDTQLAFILSLWPPWRPWLLEGSVTGSVTVPWRGGDDGGTTHVCMDRGSPANPRTLLRPVGISCLCGVLLQRPRWAGWFRTRLVLDLVQLKFQLHCLDVVVI